jgi:hypothetical protein
MDLTALALFKYSTPVGIAEYLTQERTELIAASQSEHIHSIFEQQRLLLANWQGIQAQPDSFLFTLNHTGLNRTLFWCFQGYEELHELARQMGSAQPITGMRSGHLIMQYTEENIQALASRYANEMMQLQPVGEFVIGGNCQGAIIAEAVARALAAVGRTVALLILMEHREFKLYDGSVALIFGRDSQFNPYNEVANPSVLFEPLLPQSYTIDLIDGGHGQFFSANNIVSLGKVLTKYLASAARLEAG